MLVRVNAAASGIKDYLETGRKKGREYDRDLIDDRLPLAGDIELLDDVIQSYETKQEGDSRYLHITLGFSEEFTFAAECGAGQINAERLREVVDAYRQALMAAYDPSEYLFYAEAHIPKVTHELNATTGGYERRLPHVHIVIPMRNLESDRYLNPFGHGEQTVWAAQAIQEHINRRFGLRSPLAARRDPAAPRHPLTRHAPGFEGQSPKQIRAYLADLVAQGHVDSFEQLIEAASVIGVTTIRDGQGGAYLNVKPEWADRGINLKDLRRDAFNATAQSLRAAADAPDFERLVARWQEQGAFEVRYAHGSPRKRAAYKAMTPDERGKFLTQAKAATQARLAAYDVPIPRQYTDASAAAIERALHQVEVRGLPIPRPFGSPDLIDSLFRELSRTGKSAAEVMNDAELKAGTDPVLVLEAAQQRFGIDLNDYSVAKGRDGSPRLIHEGRQYNLADFLTKHLQQSWPAARELLRACHAKTNAEPADGDALLPHGEPVASLRVNVSRTTISDRVRLAGEAIARATSRDITPTAIKATLKRRTLGQALSIALHSVTLNRPERRKSITVIEAIAASAKPRQHDAARLKQDTNPRLVLNTAEKLYGIDATQYAIDTGADGSPRIVHQGKQYNLGDFFTKHLQRPWAEAENVLLDCYHASMADALPPPDKVLWRQFSAWREQQFEATAARRTEEGAAFRVRVLKSREQFQLRKAAAQPLAFQDRVAAVALARADLVIEQQTIAAERALASAGARVPRRNAHYREYLVHLASRGNTVALAELRRMAPHQPEPEAKIAGGRSQPVFPLPSYSVDAMGAVTYRSGAIAVVKDSVQGVTVLKAQTSAYDAAIRVAVARYGRTLTLNGDSRFVDSITAAARRTGLDLTLVDASRPNAAPMRIHSRER